MSCIINSLRHSIVNSNLISSPFTGYLGGRAVMALGLAANLNPLAVGAGLIACDISTRFSQDISLSIIEAIGKAIGQRRLNSNIACQQVIRMTGTVVGFTAGFATYGAVSTLSTTHLLAMNAFFVIAGCAIVGYQMISEYQKNAERDIQEMQRNDAREIF